jgi:hypothetical protein
MVGKGQRTGEPIAISLKLMDTLRWISTKSTWYVVKSALNLESKLTTATGQCCDGSCQMRTAAGFGL